MKKLLAMLLAGLLLLSTMSMAVWADDEDESEIDMNAPLDGMLPGLDFDSLGELLEYKYGLDEDYVSRADEMGFGDGVLEYIYYEMDGIYLPGSVDMDEIDVYVDPDYVSVGFCRDDQWLELRCYNTGSDDEADIKNYIPDAEERGAFITLDDGAKAYYQYFSNRWWYYFVQDGIYFSMTNWSNTDDDELSVEYANALYHSFGEAYNLTAESSDDGKIRLCWEEIVDGPTYTIYWKRSSSDEWKTAGTTSKQKVSISGLKDGVSYDFKVEAIGIKSETVTAIPETFALLCN